MSRDETRAAETWRPRLVKDNESKQVIFDNLISQMVVCKKIFLADHKDLDQKQTILDVLSKKSLAHERMSLLKEGYINVLCKEDISSAERVRLKKVFSEVQEASKPILQACDVRIVNYLTAKIDDHSRSVGQEFKAVTQSRNNIERLADIISQNRAKLPAFINDYWSVSKALTQVPDTLDSSFKKAEEASAKLIKLCEEQIQNEIARQERFTQLCKSTVGTSLPLLEFQLTQVKEEINSSTHQYIRDGVIAVDKFISLVKSVCHGNLVYSADAFAGHLNEVQIKCKMIIERITSSYTAGKDGWKGMTAVCEQIAQDFFKHHQPASSTVLLGSGTLFAASSSNSSSSSSGSNPSTVSYTS